ncbi:MAG: TonB-dependent receptor [Candidatus Sedimenticola sp. (ex Thyasira tokunagai)]
MKIINTSWLEAARLPTLAAALLFATISHASEDNNFSESLFFGELPVVLSATRLSQPLKDTPASITVIDREMIEASGAVQLVDLLRLVPGFQVAYYTGTKYSATYHGHADQYSRDMQVLINGRSIYDPAFGGVTWGDQELEIDDIDRIEVIRGPNAAAYGSNSFAGVINIISIHPSQQQGSHLNVVAGKGANDQVSARYADSVGDLDYRVSLRYSEDSGFDTRHDSAQLRRLSFRGDYQIDPSNALQMEFGFSNNDYQDGFSGNIFQPLRSTPQEHSFQHFRWEHNSGVGSEYLLQFYHNQQIVTDSFTNSGLGFSAGSGFSSDRYDLEFQHTYGLTEKHRLVWGAGARRDETSSIWTFGSTDKIERDQLRAFFNMEWNPSDQMMVNMGGMFEKFESKDGLFSPRLALNYHLDEENTLRLIATRGYRMPTLFEDNANLRLYYAGTTTPIPGQLLYYAAQDINPEIITAYEIGFLKNIPRYNLTFDARLYNETVTDIIHTKAISGVTEQYINSGKYTINGIDIGLDWKPSRQSLIHLGYSFAHDYGKQFKSTSPGYKLLNDQAPNQTVSLLGSYRFSSGTQLSGAYYYLSEIDWPGDGDNVPYSKRLDVKISQDFKASGMDGDVALIFQNINGRFQDFYTENYWNESIFLQARLNWH